MRQFSSSSFDNFVDQNSKLNLNLNSYSIKKHQNQTIQPSKRQSNSKVPHQLSQQQTYKDKYLKCKEDVKDFMKMVQKEFQTIVDAHQSEKQTLLTQIQSLTLMLQEVQRRNQNQISNFTTNSHKTIDQNHRRSNSQQSKSSSLMCFKQIEGVQISQLSKRNGSSKNNISELSCSNTLFQFHNALKSSCPQSLNSRNISRNVSKRLQIRNLSKNHQYSHITQPEGSQSLTHSGIELNGADKCLNILNQKNNSLHNIQFSFQKKVLDKKHNLKPKLFQPSQITQDGVNNNNKQNRSGWPNKQNFKEKKNSNQSKDYVQKVLQNLRSTMQINIEKESKLQAIKFMKVN